MEYEDSFEVLPEGDIVSQLLRKSFAARHVSEQKVIVNQKPTGANSDACSEDEKQVVPRSLVHKKRLAVWERRYETPFLLAVFAISTSSSFSTMG